MLFDFADYASAGVIGTAQQPMNSVKWEDCKVTANATRDALHKAIRTGWTPEYITCDAECEAKIAEVINEYDLNKLDFFAKGDIFWDSLINSTFTEQIHKDYSKSLAAYMYSVRKLFSIFDGDRLERK